MKLAVAITACLMAFAFGFLATLANKQAAAESNSVRMQP
jgi:fructose-specific phosphotransferase system component IIB